MIRIIGAGKAMLVERRDGCCARGSRPKAEKIKFKSLFKSGYREEAKFVWVTYPRLVNRFPIRLRLA